jgi:hypothetical protein
MSDALFQIEVSVEPSRSVPGINQVDNALARLERRERTVQAANDNLRGTFDRLSGSVGKAANDTGALERTFGSLDKSTNALPSS